MKYPITHIVDYGHTVNVKSRVVLQLFSTTVTPVKTTDLLFRVFPKKKKKNPLHILLTTYMNVFVVKEMENIYSCEEVNSAMGLYLYH